MRVNSAASSIQRSDLSFSDYAIKPEIVQALTDVGITHPFPIQAMTLPVALSGHDIIGQAKTGTGKTLGFGIPLLNSVIAPGEPGFEQLPAPGKPQAIMVAPTRELATQVASDLATASKLRPGLRIVQIYGGRAYEPQVAQLQKGAEVVVGTPGRIIDLLRQGRLSLLRANTVVLDEADEMLDLGFLPDVEAILAKLPAQRHTMLFSATMPGPVVAMARRYMSQPTHIRAADPDDSSATVKNTKQHVYRAHAMDKVEVLARLLQANGRGRTIVFARTKRTADQLTSELTDRGFAAGALHGDLGQGAREQAMRALRNGKIDVLVATDVAARGIDIEDVTHVVNYQAPEDERIYVHRIGRTGRAGNKGIAVTFVDWDDVPRWSMINRALDLGIPEPVETYSTSPHLFTDLDIPVGTTGRLPVGNRVRAGLSAEKIEDIGETGKNTSKPARSRTQSKPAKRGGRANPGSATRSSDSRGSATRSPATRGSAGEGGSTRTSKEGANPTRNRTRTRTRVQKSETSSEQHNAAPKVEKTKPRASERVRVRVRKNKAEAE
ncbi:MAG: DEAD/DEAH box helicase [Cellulomonadaceae bacterium]|nr:DEAD/DEAH box helicase [Cellulomonadaceae bacterium]